MDLRKRLAALDKLSRKTNDSLKKAPAGKSRRASYAKDLTSKLQLQPMVTKAGIVWVRQYVDNLQFPLESLPDLNEVISGAKRANPNLEEIFFLDTETTGLAGGTGTLAFLVGCSWFRQGQFHTHQLFLPGPGMESALLQEIKNLSKGFSVIMTFNGGSFDLPLLRTRALMNRMQDPLDHLVSWDLLMAGRRLWGKMLANCKQQTLEKHICGLKRTAVDIEGALIPQTWFDFLEDGQTEDLEKVLYHNYRDMVGMGVLFGYVATKVSLLQEELPQAENSSWQECWALGRICEKRKNQNQAEFWIKAALAKNSKVPTVEHQLVPLYQDSLRILKRTGDWAVVHDVIENALTRGLEYPWLFREAAILFEHRLVDLSLALVYALRSGDPHRVARLQRKLL